MTLYCIAQVLPTHIIQAIAEFIQNTMADTYYNRNFPTTIKTSLIPLMGVCKHWNAAIGSLFYRSATLELCDEKNPHIDFKSVLTLDDVATMDKLPYLRRLKIDISGMGFAEINDDYVAMLKQTLDAYGPLVKVNDITLNFGDYRSTAKYAEQYKSGFSMDKFEARLADFVDCFHQLFPSKRVFSAYMVFTSQLAMYRQLFTQAIADMLPRLIEQNTSHFALSDITLTDQMVNCLQACALRRIEFTTYAGSDHYTELIRRNRASLEYLSLTSLSIHWAPNVTCLIDNGVDDKVSVYPRLKMLYLSYRYKSGEPEEMACSINPFPALEVFSCRFVNHSALIKIIEHIKLTVRAMELNIDGGQIDGFTGNELFKAGSFKRLESLLLVENASTTAYMRTGTNMMLVCALNMSPVARSVTYKVHWESSFSEDMISSMIFSDNLRSLDLGYTYFTITQAVRLFNGFNRLYKATLRLKEESSIRNIKMPAVEEIQQFRTRFKGQPSSMCMVQISKTDFFSPRRAGEYIVLMTDALPNVERIVIKDIRDSPASKIMNGVTLALKRSVYKNDVRLDNVVYLIKDFWIQ